MSKNCPNCGAPYDPALNKCPYCGTIYFDMSIVDFDNKEPIFLKIKTNGFYLTQLVRPTAGSFELTKDESVCYGGKNNTKLLTFCNNKSLMTNLSFEAISNEKQELRIIKKE